MALAAEELKLSLREYVYILNSSYNLQTLSLQQLCDGLLDERLERFRSGRVAADHVSLGRITNFRRLRAATSGK